MTRPIHTTFGRWSLMLFVTALAAGLFAAAPAQADNTNQDRLRILTYNICAQSDQKCETTYGLKNSHGTRITAANSAVVNREGGAKRPDVILLQEVGPDIFDNARVEKVFPGYKVARKTQGRWILYNSKTLVYGGTGGIATTATRDFPWARFARVGKPANKVNVVNLHLTGSDDAVAKREIASVTSSLKSVLGTRTVVAGDLNTSTGHSVMATFTSAFAGIDVPLANAVTQIRRTSTPKPDSITAAQIAPSNGKAIDHIFAGSGLARVSSEIVGDAGENPAAGTSVNTWWTTQVPNRRSDHNAVYAEMAW